MTSFQRKTGLGKGLSALLDDNDSVHPQKNTTDTLEQNAQIGSISEVKISDIETNPYQPRHEFDQVALNELSESIKVQGLIQPITVRKIGNKYQLISGERRLRASKMAGMTEIPAYIRTADDQQMLEMALIENIQRENLNAIEIALSYKRLMEECDLRQEDLGARVGKNRSTVTNYMRLLKLPPHIQVAIRDNKISMGHARALINIEDVDKQLAIFKKAVEEELSVRKVEALVKALNEGKSEKEAEKPSLDPVKKYEMNKIQQRLASHFGTKVALKADQKNRGEIKIPFQSASDLNRILEILEII